MLYYFIITTPVLLVILRLLLTNMLIPHFKRVNKRTQLSQRAGWSNIEYKILALDSLYKNLHSKSSSRWYRLQHLIQNKEFIYGEIDFLSFYTILERASPCEQDIFYDLGSGSGKAVLSAMLFFNVHQSIGIELLPPLYKQSNIQFEKAIRQFQKNNNEYLSQMQRIQFINDSFLHFDFSNADIIYVAATCLADATWNELVSKMALLKPGSRIIVATRTIVHKHFELIYEGIELMSWGLCPVRIYKLNTKALH